MFCDNNVSIQYFIFISCVLVKFLRQIRPYFATWAVDRSEYYVQDFSIIRVNEASY